MSQLQFINHWSAARHARAAARAYRARNQANSDLKQYDKRLAAVELRAQEIRDFGLVPDAQFEAELLRVRIARMRAWYRFLKKRDADCRARESMNEAYKREERDREALRLWRVQYAAKTLTKN